MKGVLSLEKIRISSYAIISDNCYLTAGEPHQLVYLTTGPRLFVLRSSLISKLTKGDVDAIPDETIRELKKNGIIVCSSVQNERDATLSRLAIKDAHTRSIAIMPTGGCNMQCEYCGQEHNSQLMTRDTVDATITYLKRSLASGNYNDLFVRWFGGEPLMAYDRILEISDRVSELCSQLDMPFESEMSSNGTLLTLERLVELQNRAHLRQLTITIDGIEDHHNGSRPLKNNGNGYKLIMNLLKSAYDSRDKLERLRISIRVNVTKLNMKGIPALIDELGAFRQSKLFSLQIIPVYDWGHSNGHLKLHPDDLDQLIVEWAGRAIGKGIRTEVLPLGKTANTCLSVGMHKDLIDPYGNIYSCTEYPLVKPYDVEKRLGNVHTYDKVQRPESDFDDFEKLFRRKQISCKECKYLPVCGGGCPRRQAKGEATCPEFTRTIQQRLNILAKTVGISQQMPN